MVLSKILKDNFNYWLENVSDEKLKDELLKIQNDEKEIENHFSQNLQFGLKEIRAPMGVGMNRINIYTVCQISQAIAQYFLAQSIPTPKIIITYDARPNSQEFAMLSVMVFKAAGYDCTITSTPNPTSYLSFLVKELKADAGISITGGHNGIEYNGFKIFNSNGSQLDYRELFYINQISQKINPFDIYKSLDFSQKNSICKLDDSLQDKFIDCVFNQRVENRLDKLVVVCQDIDENHIVMQKIFDRLGVQAHFVNDSFSHSNLSTIASDNSHYFGTALLKAIQINADLIIIPSIDYCRIDVMVKDEDNYQYVNGNDLALIFSHYLLKNLASKSKRNYKPLVLRSMVSSPIIDKMVSDYGGDVIQCTPSFQDICAKLNKLESEANPVVLGFEENGSFIRGNYALSASALFSSVLICDVISSLYEKNISPIDYIQSLTQEYVECNYKKLRFNYSGVGGDKMRDYLMDALAQCPPDLIDGERILRLINYNYKEELRSNTIEYAFMNNDKIFIRPSSTEETIFCYIYLFGENASKMESIVQQMFNLLVKSS